MILKGEKSIMKKMIISITLIMLLSGCAGFEKLPPNVDFGAAPVNYQQTVKDYMETVLFDAGSAKYIFLTPLITGHYNQGLIYGGKIAWSGWILDVKINAKNRHGGYTGYQKMMIFFEGNKIVKHSSAYNHPALFRHK